MKTVSPMHAAMIATIRRIPKGKVATYGGIAETAGYPRAARQVAVALNGCRGPVPWHRVLGAGGRISLSGENALEQRMLLEAEGVIFRGKRVLMSAHEWRPGVARRTRKR